MPKQRIKREKDFENGAVTFTVIETGETLSVTVKELPEDIKTALVVHGLNAKVGDAAADPKVGALEAMTAVAAQLKDGTWAARAAGEGGTRSTQLSEALVRVTGKTAEEVAETLGGMSDDEKKEVKNHPQVAAALADIQAEKAKAKAKAAAKSAGSADALEF